MQTQPPIHHDFHSGKIKDAGIVERLGMLGLRTAAWITRPISSVGFSKAAWLIRTFLPSKRSVQTMLFKDTTFEYPYADAYWAVLASNGDVYSIREESFLMAIRGVDYAFIDGGANFGYMASIVTSDAYGKKPAIAIEADPDTYQFLQRNASLNNNRFAIRHNAIFSKSGEMVNIHGDKHEARSILDENGNQGSGNVETLALNDLSDWVNEQNKEALVIKLDVEGVEIDAIKGADKLLEKNLLVMFEDHGSDKTNEVSRYFMETLEMKVFISETNGCRELKTIEDVAALKTNSRVGYDLIATQSDFWLNKIRL